MKNYRTPCTLSDSTFESGYPTIPRRRQSVGAPSVLLACAIGAALAWVIIYGWAM